MKLSRLSDRQSHIVHVLSALVIQEQPLVKHQRFRTQNIHQGKNNGICELCN